SVVPKRWILGIFALGLIAVMVATSASPWAGAATLPTTVTATALSPTSIQVDWIAVNAGSTVPGGSPVVDSYSVECGGGTPVVESGILTTTATISDLDANTEYVCSVSAASGSTLPGSGEAADSITTPLSLAVLLESVVVSPASATIQVGGGQVLTATVKGKDTDGTTITGLTVSWGISGNGSLGSPFGTDDSQVTYTATSSGSATVTATVSQSTGIERSENVVFTNFSAPVTTSPPTGSDPTDPADIPTAPSLGGETQAATAVVQPSTGASLTIPKPADDDTDFQFATTATVDVPVNAVASGTALALVIELVPQTGGTSVAPTQVKQEDFVSLPSGVNPVNAEPLVVQFIDTDGNEVTGITLNEPVTISLTVPTADLFAANQDPQSVAVFKAADPAVGPWNELATTFTFVDGGYKFAAQTFSFSTFKLGSKTREIGIPIAGSGAVLPSAGDSAPTATQAILVTTLGLLLAAGAGAYIRRQRKATSAE
ncbi:MAG: fibronectin type III domain-containing protein, partial [Chloroflexi bacterium]|nr:fibronectin type III domain-containing protein [Chloroflexota bacterium]